jgi:hypothetical protein
MDTANISNRMSDAVEEAASCSLNAVRQHAMPATMAAFGLGLGSGVALVYLLCEHSSMREDANAAQRLGRRVLDAIAGVVPDSLAKLGK